MDTGRDDEPGEGCEAARRERLLGRVYAALEAKMAEIETRIARAREGAGEIASPADSERDVRTLNTLTRLIEKIALLSEAPGEAEGGTVVNREAEAIDAERMREQIAERIARLRRCETI